MLRRHFLKGLFGATVGLPFLESFQPRAAHGQTRAGVKRFVAFFQSCGVEVNTFWPAEFGALTEASFAGNRGISPLAAYRDKLLIPRGIHNSPRGYNFDDAQNGANDHQLGTASRLCAVSLSGSGDHYARGISVDQEMAKSLHPDGKPALTLGVGRKANGADGAISFLGSERPAPRQDNPWLVYQDFMGLTNVDDSIKQAILTRRQTVLDLVKADFDDLKASPRLSQADRDKLDLHFTTIREVETNMGDGGGAVTCTLAADTVEELRGIDPETVRNDSQFPVVGRLQMDVLALALACGHTRVATLMWGSGEGGPVMRWLGQTAEQHLISHRVTSYGAENPLAGAREMLSDIDRWYGEQFAYLLGKLQAYDEGGVSLLDNCAVVWLNELSDGKGHSYLDLPFVIAGSCGGYFKQGQYIKLTGSSLGGGSDPIYGGEDAPHNKLLTTFLNAVGATRADGSPYENFGAYGDPGIYSELLV